MIPLYSRNDDGTWCLAAADLDAPRACRDEPEILWLVVKHTPVDGGGVGSPVAGSEQWCAQYTAIVDGTPGAFFLWPKRFRSLDAVRAYARKHARKHDLTQDVPAPPGRKRRSVS